MTERQRYIDLATEFESTSSQIAKFTRDAIDDRWHAFKQAMSF